MNTCALISLGRLDPEYKSEGGRCQGHHGVSWGSGLVGPVTHIELAQGAVVQLDVGHVQPGSCGAAGVCVLRRCHTFTGDVTYACVII